MKKVDEMEKRPPKTIFPTEKIDNLRIKAIEKVNHKKEEKKFSV